MKKEKKEYALITLSLAVLLFLFLMATLNIKHIAEPVELLLHGQYSFSQMRDELEKKYTSDDLAGKEHFVNLSGLFARASGRRVFNEVILMKNGMLTSEAKELDCSIQCVNMTEFAHSLKEQGIDFLYVQAPYKIDADKALLPVGTKVYADTNADVLLQYLQGQQIRTLDLRPQLSATKEQIEEYFYKTDHHWNGDGAFLAFRNIAEELRHFFPGLDMTCTDKALWQKNVKEDFFLGYYGKRVGSGFAGTDDFDWYTPKFETQMSCAYFGDYNLKRGTFEDAILYDRAVAERDLFGKNPYAVYFGKEESITQIRNSQAKNDRKLLIIKDSFSLPVQAFLSTMFTEIDVLDPRYYRESEISEYVEATAPDAVLVLLNAGDVGLVEFSYFGRVTDVLQAGDRGSKPRLWETLHATEREGEDTWAELPVECGKRYVLSFDDVQFTGTQKAGVSVTLYEQEQRGIWASAVFDVDYCRTVGGVQWVFTVPQPGQGDFVLRLHAGLLNQAADAEAVYTNVWLGEVERG